MRRRCRRGKSLYSVVAKKSRQKSNCSPERRATANSAVPTGPGRTSHLAGRSRVLHSMNRRTSGRSQPVQLLIRSRRSLPHLRRTGRRAAASSSWARCVVRATPAAAASVGNAARRSDFGSLVGRDGVGEMASKKFVAKRRDKTTPGLARYSIQFRVTCRRRKPQLFSLK